MKKAAYVGLLLLLVAVSPVSLRAQDGPQAQSKPEYDAYAAFYNEQDLTRKAQLGEAFLADFPESEFIPTTHQLLVYAYAGLRDWSAVITVADRFSREAAEGAEPSARAYVYQNAMAAAQLTGDSPRILQYGNRLLEVDRNNLGAMLTLSSVLTQNLPPFGSERERALAQVFDLSNRARIQAQQFFASGAQPDAQRIQVNSTIHSNLGFVHLTRGDYGRAVEEYQDVLRLSPRDWNAHYRLGEGYQGLAGEASTALAEAIAEGAEPTGPAATALQNSVLGHLDRAIDAYARAAVGGGAIGASARPQVEALYRQRHDNSLEGLNELIEQVRTEMSSR